MRLCDTRNGLHFWAVGGLPSRSEGYTLDLNSCAGGFFAGRAFQKFAAAQAVCQPAIWAYNLCVLPQRELGPPEKVQLQTLRQETFQFFDHFEPPITLRMAAHGQLQGPLELLCS